jgi:hypothetical protein
MTTFFYLLAIAFLFYEISVISGPIKHFEFLKKISNKEIWRDDKDFAGKGCVWIIFQLFYIIWAILGFALSSNWKLFGLLLLVSFSRGFLMKFSSNRNWKSLLILLDGVVSATVITVIFMKHFHPEILPW